MRSLFQIDNDILNCVDEETGEFNEEAFEALQIERENKIENLVCWHKNITAYAKALKEQEDEFKERRKKEEDRAKRIGETIKKALDGNEFKTAKVKVTFRASQAVECSDDFLSWAESNKRNDLLRYKAEPNKDAIKKAILKGEKLPAQIVDNNNMTIK